MLLTALSSSSLWVQFSNRSVSFDLTPLSIVKTALSKQPCHWDGNEESFAAINLPVTSESLHPIWATLSYLLSFFISLARLMNSSRVTSHRCTEGHVVLMSHIANISLFSSSFLKFYHCSVWPPHESKVQQGSVKIKAYRNYRGFVTSQRGWLWNLSNRFYRSWTNKSQKIFLKASYFHVAKIIRVSHYYARAYYGSLLGKGHLEKT